MSTWPTCWTSSQSDPQTESVLLYAEGFNRPRRFLSALRGTARLKPVIVGEVPDGKPRGLRAAITHSGSLVGRDDIFDAALRRAGAVRVLTYSQLFSAAKRLPVPLPALWRPARDRHQRRRSGRDRGGLGKRIRASTSPNCRPATVDRDPENPPPEGSSGAQSGGHPRRCRRRSRHGRDACLHRGPPCGRLAGDPHTAGDRGRSRGLEGSDCGSAGKQQTAHHLLDGRRSCRGRAPGPSGRLDAGVSHPGTCCRGLPAIS